MLFFLSSRKFVLTKIKRLKGSLWERLNKKSLSLSLAHCTILIAKRLFELGAGTECSFSRN